MAGKCGDLSVLEFSPENERVASMQLQVAGGKALTVVCANAAVQNTWPSYEYDEYKVMIIKIWKKAL